MPPAPRMREPHLTRFRELIREGAGTLDIHDGQIGSSYTMPARATEDLIRREIARVDVHRRSLCRLLARHVGEVSEVLDVGCGTGATTVAIALDEELGATRVIGVDPNQHSLAAAEVRARGCGVEEGAISFVHVAAGAPFPFEDDRFDLVVCVSVLEYLHDLSARSTLAKELVRVVRRGGVVCLVTPNPYRLFDRHTHRLLGDWRRSEGYPWASTPGQLRAMFDGNEVRFLRGEQLEHGFSARGLPAGRVVSRLGALAFLLPWQKLLVRKAT